MSKIGRPGELLGGLQRLHPGFDAIPYAADTTAGHQAHVVGCGAAIVITGEANELVWPSTPGDQPRSTFGHALNEVSVADEVQHGNTNPPEGG